MVQQAFSLKSLSVYKTIIFHFSTKTYVVGTQKNHPNETVLLSTKNMLKLMGKKILQFYAEQFCLFNSVVQASLHICSWNIFIL